MRLLSRSLLMIVLMLPISPLSAHAPLVFSDVTEEARFHALTRELRCVQCHNQSLADSDALIAQDMRRQVLSLMQQGHSDAEIKQFLVQRYGEFVLYRPVLEPATWLLWGGPLLLLLSGAALIWRTVARRARRLPAASQTTEEPPVW